MDERERLVDSHEAGERLGVSAGTLKAWRTRRSDGPPFVKVGSLVRYRVRDLDAWADGRRVKNTAGTPAGAAAA